MKKQIMAMAAVIISSASLLFAAMPNQTHYEGIITNSDGSPKSGSLSLTFSLYTAASGGTRVWNETKTVKVNSGLCSTDLGSSTLLNDSIWSHVSLWLGVKVGTDREMTPRTRILAVPYALRCKVAESVIGGTQAGLGYMPVGTVLQSTNSEDELLKNAGFKQIGALAPTAVMDSIAAPFEKTDQSQEVNYSLVTSNDHLFALQADMNGTLWKKYNEAAKVWEAMASLPVTSTMTSEIVNKIYKVGSDLLFLGSEMNNESSYFYKTETDTWVTVPITNAPTADGTTGQLPNAWDGSTLTVVGQTNMLQNIYSYSPTTNTWTKGGAVPQGFPSYDVKCAVNGNDILFYSTSVESLLYAYNTQSKVWKEISIGSERAPSIIMVTDSSFKLIIQDSYQSTSIYQLDLNTGDLKLMSSPIVSSDTANGLCINNYLILTGDIAETIFVDTNTSQYTSLILRYSNMTSFALSTTKFYIPNPVSISVLDTLKNPTIYRYVKQP